MEIYLQVSCFILEDGGAVSLFSNGENYTFYFLAFTILRFKSRPIKYLIRPINCWLCIENGYIRTLYSTTARRGLNHFFRRGPIKLPPPPPPEVTLKGEGGGAVGGIQINSIKMDIFHIGDKFLVNSISEQPPWAI